MRKYLGIVHYLIIALFLGYFIFCAYIWFKPAEKVPQTEFLSKEELESIASAGVLDGWVEENGEYYYYENGEKTVNQWIDDTYYVGEDGIMLKDTITPDGYMVDENGRYVPQ